MAALARRGVAVASAKVGPDFIDPGYHQVATGRPGRNLDPWMCGAAAVPGLAARAGSGADVTVIEGVMGLFDGAADGSASSTAAVATALEAPVVLVVDCSSAGQSIAAVVHGFATFNPEVRLAGVVLNKVASESHEAMVRGALADVTSAPLVLGAIRREDRLAWRDRHLGLIPVAERPAEVAGSLDRLAALVAESVDLDAVMAIARSAPTRTVAPVVEPQRVGTARVAVAGGPAFTFQYPDNVEALSAAGAEIEVFDPLTAAALPAGVDALVVGGGFPEVMVEDLAANEPLLVDVRARVAAGLVVWAECGGLLWLSQSLDGRAMAGVVPARAHMSDRLVLGYREAVTTVASPLGPAGLEVRGHEFHYSATDPAGTALTMTGRTGSSAGGFASPTLLASYLHVHLASRPDLAEAFVRAASGGPGAGGADSVVPTRR